MGWPLPGQGELPLKRIVNKSRQSFQPKESQIELAICYFLRSRNVFFFKTVSNGYFDARINRFRKHANPFVGKGCPDLVLILDSLFVGIEIKSEKGRQSEDQKAFEERCKAAGGFYFIARSVEDVAEILNLMNAYIAKLYGDD
jgi:hypothetical protein